MSEQPAQGSTLAGRVVIVTGGNGGIGLGMGQAMAAQGASIAIWARDRTKSAQAVAALKVTGADAEGFQCDVSDEASVDAAMAATLERFGKVDSLFANAGRNGTSTTLVDTSLEDWRAVMAVNLDGVFLTFRAAARHMIERGEGGSLVGVSSTSAVHGAAGNLAYGSGKTAILGLVRGLAVELARHQIRVNALLPGWTITELASGAYANDRFREVTTKRTPVRRWADPSEMGSAAVFLADPANTFHTGDRIVVDGGYTIF